MRNKFLLAEKRYFIGQIKKAYLNDSQLYSLKDSKKDYKY